MQHTETLSVHAGRTAFRALGVHAPPLDFSTTYPIHDLDGATASLDAFVQGHLVPEEPIYARLFNPTVARFEEGIAQLEGASASVAFGSGMAALTACLLATRPNGTHVVAVRPLYGSSDHLLGSSLLGMSVTFTNPEGVCEALRPDTALVVIETPANPTVSLVDIADIVVQAGSVPVLVDATFATPILLRPIDFGATFVLHSATKFIGGHGDVMAGVVSTSDFWAEKLRQVRIMTGGLLHPMGAYLLHRGLPTLPIRVERAQASAQILAARLHTHDSVKAVFYPGLPDGDPKGLIGRQMKGPGSILSFEVPDHEAAARVLKRVRLITPAVSLGSTDTLIQHPAGLTHRVVSEEGKTAGHISEGLLRLSVGLEQVEDLWADIEQALATP
ncbi:MAG TPA: PLP-dependent aspartate aminotransferase family protein [Rhodothermales bacterium]|nr:cystathionine gamma-synthase [Bacteroidota bacterium]HRK73793.1 PLP-dependent aspartate aminotransferase family protein [Rhodothermales bacterium]HRR08475.1 PLP-dependent aspartate aminotransferase family protein [Rhodothermales bacterium]